MLRLALRIVPLFAVIVGLVASLGAYMAYSEVRTAYLNVIRSRLAIEAQEIGLAIERALSLGIALPAQSVLRGLLVERAAGDPLVLSIDVLSRTGEVLFSSRTDRVGMRLDPAVGEPDVMSYQRPVSMDFGAPVGDVVVRTPRAVIDRRIAQVAAEVAATAVPAGLAAVLTGSLAAFLVLRGLRQRARAVAVRLAAAGPADTRLPPQADPWRPPSGDGEGVA